MIDLAFGGFELTTEFIESISYLGMFLFIMLSGYLIPIPEEISLILAGYIAGMGPEKVYLAVLLGFAGVLIGDNALYFLSLNGSRYADRLKNRMKKNKLSKYEEVMRRHIGKAIFFLRFIVGVRFFGPVLAGTIKVRWRKFFFFNSAASFLHVLFFVALGYFFRHSLLSLVAEVEIIRHILFFFSASIVGLAISIFSHKSFLRKYKFFRKKKSLD